jgi:hypothetical protein
MKEFERREGKGSLKEGKSPGQMKEGGREQRRREKQGGSGLDEGP